MADLADGESVEMQGSGSKPYVLRNVGGVYSCSCPAWRNQSVAIESRTCKHLKKLRGDAAEATRIGTPATPVAASGTAADPKQAKTGPPLLLAETWDDSQDYRGWWMSEKLDGVRAYWTGTQFLSRLGNVYHAPDWFVADLPQQPLDGELWLGRKQFQRSVSIVRRQDKSDHWKEIQFLIFDAPASPEPFESRMKLLQDLIRKGLHQYARLHEHAECKGSSHLLQELQRVESMGGEGLMLRRPASKYEVGRSQTLIKVKTFQDAEARVIGHQPGAGRHKGQLGALLVELPNGKQFSVGTGFTDAQRRQPPPIGATIKFRYQELSDYGVPRFPSYVGVRQDVLSVAATSAGTTSTTVAPASPAKRPAKSKATTQTTVDSASTSGASQAVASTSTRMFEFQDGKADKFWEITLNNLAVTVRYGRRGSDGQTNTKDFPDVATAQKHAAKLIDEKTGKGYTEVISSDSDD